MMPPYATGQVTRATASTLGRSFASARLTIPRSSLMAARLPDQRDETMTNPLPVLLVTRQIPREDSFFVEEPPEQEWRHRGDRNEAPVRAERERRSEDIECPARTWIRLPWVCIAPILVHEFPDLAFFPLL